MIGKFDSIMKDRANIVPENWTGHKGLKHPTLIEVEQMMESALAFCSHRSSKTVKEIVKLISSNDLWANSTLRYALAKEIQKALSTDPKVRDLYIFGSSIEDRARLTSDINMILHVDDQRKDFEIWFLIVDEGLRKEFRKHFAVGKGFVTLLNYHIVTEKDISRHAGYAPMLTSNHPPLTKLYESHTYLKIHHISDQEEKEVTGVNR